MVISVLYTYTLGGVKNTHFKESIIKITGPTDLNVSPLCRITQFCIAVQKDLHSSVWLLHRRGHLSL
jgi:hypothetical protein